jgi:lipoyl(octanoyl) transferase
MIIRHKARLPYLETLKAMQAFTEARRHHACEDELWLLEHPPVFTLGQAGRPEHILSTQGIPVVQSDRGGQVTYHGPGQLIGYLLHDLKKAGIGIRTLVHRMEAGIIDCLASFGIEAYARPDAPGVYVGGSAKTPILESSKIASLGLRVRHGLCYHGFALNIDMDLSPFACINPCGYAQLRISQCTTFNPHASWDAVLARIPAYIESQVTRGKAFHPQTASI